MNWHAEANFAVTIAGGSIGGLCAAVALRGIGADVHIYERVTGPMETRGAGIVVQSDLVQLLRQHHAPDLPMTACRVRVLRPGWRGWHHTGNAPTVHVMGGNL